MSEHKLPSKKLKMDYVGPLFIYSRYDKYLYILATIDGTVIEQVFHASRLKKGFLRLPNQATITNMNDLQKEKEKQAKLLSDGKDKITTDKCAVPRTHHLVDCTLTADLWYHDAQFLVSRTSFQDKPSEQHHYLSLLHPELWQVDIDFTFHMSEESHHNETCTVTKGSYKFGNLEVFCLYNSQTCKTGQWITIPHSLETDYNATMYNLHLNTSGSRNKFISKMFLWF
jgi:hypothetical protein